MNPSRNFWASRFDGLDDIESIKSRARVNANPLHGLMEEPCAKATTRLESELSRVFYPTIQACILLREHVQRAQSFVEARYPLTTSFLALASPEDASVSAASCWCLTGPAGVGKTSLMAALARLMPLPTTAFVSAAYPQHPLIGFQRVIVQAKAREVDLLREMGNAAVLVKGQRLQRAALLYHVQQWFLTTGVGTLSCDELQFVTQSAAANTRVAQLLLTLTYLWVPFTFVANYSLVHRLIRRPQEERQRLLVNPKLLLPDPPDSECWRGVLQSMLAAAPQAFAIDATSHGEELHRYCGGLKRVLRQLLVLSFQIAHSRTHQRQVMMDDVRDAYRSSGFSANREDVECSLALAVSPSQAALRTDLVCPFPARGRPREAPKAGTAVSREKLVASAVVRGALLKDERQVLSALQRAADQALGKEDSATVVVPLRRARKAVTLDDLLQGGAAADRMNHAKGKSNPPSTTEPECP